jgi:hypothetical protein
MDITTASPAEIDTELHRLDAKRIRLGMRLTSLRRDLGEAENIEAGYGRRSTRKVASVDNILSTIAEIEYLMGDCNRLARPLREEFIRRGGWTRWYLVPDGHLHYDISGDRCSRIPTTDHYWMTEYSGRSAAEMIELAGDRVCTTCFPDAPVAPRPAAARFMTPSEAERTAYREAQTRKRAAAKAAQILTPDGAELRAANGVHGDLIKTEVAARRRALQDASDIAFYGTGHPSFDEWRETVDRMIAALAHRTGMDEGTLRAEINGKVAKKAKREQWERKATI